MIPADIDGPEARRWLKGNRHPAALASNRFRSTAEALNFVESLYAAGAKKVIIVQNSIRDEEVDWGGPYADSIFIELLGANIPQQLIDLYLAEAEHEGYDLTSEPPPVIGENYLYFWWD